MVTFNINIAKLLTDDNPISFNIKKNKEFNMLFFVFKTKIF